MAPMAERAVCACRRMEGKIALVTGSTAGIGRAIATRLLQEGATVVVSSRKQERVDETVKALALLGSVHGVVCHVAKQRDRQELVDFVVGRFGRIDLLVLNVAISTTYGPMLSTTEAEWHKMLHTNLVSAIMLTQQASGKMDSGSSILFVSSIAGFQPMPALGAYSTTKTGLLGLIKALSIELAPRNLRVNAIAPGIVATRLSRALVEDPEKTKKLVDQIPLGRLGRASEVAAAAAFCLSEDASYVTGETLVVAGGMPSRL